MSQERAFFENVHQQRVNFFLVFFGLTLAGTLNADEYAYFVGVLVVGAMVTSSLALTVVRSQRKLSVMLHALAEDPSHPVRIVNELVRRKPASGARERLLRVIDPFRGYASARSLLTVVVVLCSALLVVLAVLAACGVITPQPNQ